MLATSPLIAFVATTARERAKAFYHDLLGLPLRSEDDFALVFDANGTMLRVVDVEALTPAERTVLGWRVEDIESAVRALRAHGVRCERYAWCVQDALDIWTTDNGSRVAWFKDPDGNLLSLTELAG